MINRLGFETEAGPERCSAIDGNKATRRVTLGYFKEPVDAFCRIALSTKLGQNREVMEVILVGVRLNLAQRAIQSRQLALTDWMRNGIAADLIVFHKNKAALREELHALGKDVATFW